MLTDSPKLSLQNYSHGKNQKQCFRITSFLFQTSIARICSAGFEGTHTHRDTHTNAYSFPHAKDIFAFCIFAGFPHPKPNPFLTLILIMMRLLQVLRIQSRENK